MKSFHCTHCQTLVFFENVRCLHCGHALAYLPARAEMAAIEQGADELWRPEGKVDATEVYRRCANYEQHDVCNWAVASEAASPYCESCRLTRTIPDLSRPENKTAWYRLEVAKRRLIYTLMALDLPLVTKSQPNDAGLAFDFLEDASGGDRARVLTGHDNGLITINIAEADDVQREQQRLQQHEPYRTVLGHFRHEIGHYYWDRLISGGPREAGFRELFGDERVDYQHALQVHYSNGPQAGWVDRFISAYASSHPWEDWAESWAHYLHMIDTLEIAGSAGLSLRPPRADEPSMAPPPAEVTKRLAFDQMIEDWVALTYVLNSLNRGLGLADSYPFVLSDAVVAKLHFVHETINA